MSVEWFKPEEVAERWRTSPQTIVREIRSGRLTAFALGRSYRIHRDSIARRENDGVQLPQRPSGIESVPDEIGDC